MPYCPTCGQQADHRVYSKDSAEFPAGPAIRVCHASGGAYIHVIGDE